MKNKKSPILIDKTVEQTLVLKDGAIFIADSHHKKGAESLPNFLNKLILTPPSQVFLMGDIFHLFVGHLISSRQENQSIINQINELSEVCEVYYFEGNHDFGIDTYLFPKVKIYPRILQPASFYREGKHYLLAHGDIFITKSYEFYIRLLTNSLTLSLLKLLDFLSLGLIYKITLQKVYLRPIKSLQMDEKHFKSFAIKRLKEYLTFIQKNRLNPIEGIIEGHFHIGQEIKITKNELRDWDNQELNIQKTIHYISLPSYFCTQNSRSSFLCYVLK